LRKWPVAGVHNEHRCGIWRTRAERRDRVRRRHAVRAAAAMNRVNAVPAPARAARGAPAPASADQQATSHIMCDSVLRSTRFAVNALRTDDELAARLDVAARLYIARY